MSRSFRLMSVFYHTLLMKEFNLLVSREFIDFPEIQIVRTLCWNRICIWDCSLVFRLCMSNLDELLWLRGENRCLLWGVWKAVKPLLNMLSSKPANTRLTVLWRTFNARLRSSCHIPRASGRNATVTPSSGHYLYVDTSVGHRDHSSILVSDVLQPSNAGHCLTFWYNMHGSSVGTLYVGINDR